jgi:ABC-type lipoprotein release transport system permease subunit
LPDHESPEEGITNYGTISLRATEIYGVRPLDPLVLASVMGLLAMVLLGACAVPARRAMRVDPIVALRSE